MKYKVKDDSQKEKRNSFKMCYSSWFLEQWVGKRIYQDRRVGKTQID
jgi:hypothetical protein